MFKNIRTSCSMMKAVCLCLIICSIYHYVQGIIIYVNENSTNVLRCPLKADIGFRIDWNGPPSFMAYTIGTDINQKLPHSDRISVVGKIEEGEYNLQISNIQQSDIGQYQCYGYLDGNIETALLELYVAVPPVTGPSISRNPSGPLFVGNTIVLKCEVIGGTPLAKISWQCDGFFGEHNTSTDNNIESTVNSTLRQSDNNKKCKCVANHPSWTSQKSVDIVLNVFFAPDTNLTLQRKPAEGIISGNKVNITCTASGGNPLATLSWNCSGTNTNYTTEKTVSYSVEFEVDKSDNNKVCTCSATHPITSYTPQIHSSLIVYYAPGTNPFIEQKPLGGIPVGHTVTLTCTVAGGNPLATLSWNCTGITKNETAVERASYSIEFTVDRSFNNKICVCTADHKINTYRPTVQHKLVVYYAPSDLPRIQQTPPGGIITGRTVMLTCSVKGGNPPAILIWNCTGDTTNSTTDNTANYSVSFPVNKSQNKAICACSALHPVSSYKPVTEHSLEVYYVPGTNPIILQNPPGGILTGNNVILTCSVPGGNPLAILSWNCTGTMENNTTGNTASYSITLSVDKSYNNKICRCTADHVISTYKPTVQQNLVVYYAPDYRPSIQATPPGGIITGQTVMLTCSVKGGNPLAILRWNCTGDMTNIITDTAAMYSVSFTVSKTQNKAICACSASHPVTSYTPVIYHSLEVYFAPDTNLNIQKKPAGGIISGNKVNLTCTASGGNPLATLSWNCSGTNTNYTTGNTASHSVEFEVDKSDNNKVCTCSATHPFSSSYKPTVETRLLVYFKPFLDTTKFNSTTNIALSEDDHLFITVSVKSNPHPIIKWTFLAQANIHVCNNSVINSTSINNGLHSSSNISIRNLKKNQFGEYTFIATNDVGVFLRKFSVLEKEKPLSPSYVYVVCKSKTAIVICQPILKGNLLQELYIQYTEEGQDITSIQVHMKDRNQPIEYTVTGLYPGRKYNFSILAVNLFGETRSKQVECLTDTLSTGEDVLALREDNSILFNAGIASLVIGLLFFVAATIFIFRKRFRKTYTKSSKSDEYSDLQTCNPAFQDPYTSIQNPIESRHQQESSANTYEECGNASNAAAYQNIENMKSGHKKAEKKMGIYDNMKI